VQAFFVVVLDPAADQLARAAQRPQVFVGQLFSGRAVEALDDSVRLGVVGADADVFRFRRAAPAS
jgi:hypothetical protein